MPTRYYAAYLQSVRMVTGDRTQMIVVPPVARIPGAEYPATWEHKFVWWERTQTLDAQRPRWRTLVETSLTSPWERFSAYTGDPWQVSEPIVVPTTPSMVQLLLKEGRTPYRLITQLEKKARLRGIQIQGPTSIPQVVTPVTAS